MSYCEISHKINPSIKFKIRNPAFKYDKEIEYGNLDALKFVVNYINYYSNDKIEFEYPEYPLEHHINDIFKEEQDLFLPLLETENETSESIIHKIKFARDIAYIAEEVGYTKLFKKISAIIAHYLDSKVFENNN